MDRFAELRAFVEVVRTGAFVKVADALNLSKTAVSRQVGDLEKRLGVRLLNRTTRRLSLTDEGQRFHEHARTVLAELEAAEADVMTRARDVTGLLRITAPLSFGILHLASLWPEFRARHPGAMLDVTLGDRVVDLVDEGYDLAIRIARLPDSTLVSRRLAGTRMVLCASPAYLRRHGAPRHPHELAAHATLSYSYWSGGDEWQFTGPQGAVSVRVQPWMHTNNGDSCREAALAGSGIILQPTFMLAGDLRKNTLVELMPEFRAVELGVYAVYPTRRYLLPRVRAMVDFLAERFREPPWPG
jgi:DNA-binding transcriptional LysR family regulator